MRPIWSGTISFGLVSVPVRMFSATESKELRFHFLDKKDLAPIGYEKVRKDTGESVDPELTHTIDICDFADLEEIDPIYFCKAYYLLPQEGAEKPHRLLVRAYRKELLELIRAKAKGKKLPEPKEEEEEEGEVADLMAALRESVERMKKTQRRASSRSRAKKAS
jgi:non-homologous end joining protein Ku